MPPVSKKQEKFMRAVAENPKFAKKVGVPQSVGKEFTMKKMMMGGMAKMTKSEKPSGMGKVKTAAPSKDGVATKGKTRGKMVKMAEGGMASLEEKRSRTVDPNMPKGRRPGEGMLQEKLRKIVPPARKSGMAKGGMTKMRYGGKC